MRNSGYLAVGHLLTCINSREDVLRVLKCFVTALTINLDDDLIDKTTALWKFDQFFKYAKVSLHLFARYLEGILKKPQVSNEILEVEVEKQVWNLVRTTSEDPTLCKQNYQLFCIFNRFADPLAIPFKIDQRCLSFILKSLEVQTEKIQNLPTDEKDFEAFLKLLHDCEIAPSILERLFGKVVQNIVQAGRLSGKIQYNE